MKEFTATIWRHNSISEPLVRTGSLASLVVWARHFFGDDSAEWEKTRRCFRSLDLVGLIPIKSCTLSSTDPDFCIELREADSESV